jgi:hypothetical protein
MLVMKKRPAEMKYANVQKAIRNSRTHKELVALKREVANLKKKLRAALS